MQLSSRLYACMNAAWVDAGISRVRECGSPLEFHQVMRGGAWHSNPCPSLHKAVLLLCHEHAMVGVRVLGSNGTVKKGAPGCSSWRASGITTTHAEEDTHQHTPKPHTVSKGVSSACPHTQLCWSCALIHLRAILRSRKLLNTPTSITAPPPPPPTPPAQEVAAATTSTITSTTAAQPAAPSTHACLVRCPCCDIYAQ
jgi:hypothetical protein